MLKLAKVFTNHMVLQRNKPIKIFGLADGEVRVSFDGETVFTKPENGKWVAELSPHTHGGPYEIEISSGDEKIVLSDVLIGDVRRMSFNHKNELVICIGRQKGRYYTTGNHKISSFGKSVFLTKEEAEKALEEQG